MYFLAILSQQGQVTAWDANGQAATRNATHTCWAPKLYFYKVDYAVKSGRRVGKNWALCIVPDGFVLPAGVLTDPDIIRLDSGQSDRRRSISAAERDAINAKLALTDLGEQASTGETLDDVVDRIATTLGHTGFASRSR